MTSTCSTAGTRVRTSAGRAQSRLVVGLVAATMTAATTLAPLAPAVAKATQQCPAGGVKVQVAQSPASVSVPDTTTGTSVPVLVTLRGPSFTVTATAGAAALETARWCVKASTQTNSGAGTTGVSNATNKRGAVHDISYVVLYSVTTAGAWPAPQCWGSSYTDQPDLLYVGPENVASPATDDTASALCRTLKLVPLGSGAFSLNRIAYLTAPADAYYCVYL